MSRSPAGRVGRPPASDSAVTRQRILDSARQLFGSQGYRTTTTKNIADASGVTTGSVYYYFGSKESLYVAVYHTVRDEMFRRLGAAAEATDTFVEGVAAIFDEAVNINLEDPSVTAFYVAVATESRYNRELVGLADEQRSSSRTFFSAMVEKGKQTGELSDDVDAEVLADVLAAIGSGLARASVGLGNKRHREMMEFVRRMISGELIHAPVGD